MPVRLEHGNVSFAGRVGQGRDASPELAPHAFELRDNRRNRLRRAQGAPIDAPAGREASRILRWMTAASAVALPIAPMARPRASTSPAPCVAEAVRSALTSAAEVSSERERARASPAGVRPSLGSSRPAGSIPSAKASATFRASSEAAPRGTKRAAASTSRATSRGYGRLSRRRGGSPRSSRCVCAAWPLVAFGYGHRGGLVRDDIHDVRLAILTGRQEARRNETCASDIHGDWTRGDVATRRQRPLAGGFSFCKGGLDRGSGKRLKDHSAPAQLLHRTRRGPNPREIRATGRPNRRATNSRPLARTSAAIHSTRRMSTIQRTTAREAPNRKCEHYPSVPTSVPPPIQPIPLPPSFSQEPPTLQTRS